MRLKFVKDLTLIPLTALLSGLILLAPVHSSADEDKLREQLRQRLEQLHETGAVRVADSTLLAPGPLQSLYEANAWQPLWFRDWEALEQLSRVPATLKLAAAHGLDPDHYHQATLASALERISDNASRPQALVDAELLATDALLSLAHHLAHGRIHPESIDPEWFIERDQPELKESVIRHALGNKSGQELLESLLPTHRAYHRLVEQLALKREMASNGKWLTVASGLPLIRPGQYDERIPAIRHQLARLDDSTEALNSDNPERYDARLEDAVRRFQRRHGLAIDGIIGPADPRCAQRHARPSASINCVPTWSAGAGCRSRWVKEYILVNIAGFGMQVVSGGEEIMRQRVVVGQPYRRTPVFTDRMSYLVINPSWEVPHRLATQDQLPRIRANPDYLHELGFAVLQGWGAEERRMDPDEIDWQSLSRNHFPFRLRQAPGPDNALGRVKFMFPNRHNVYLHDTPAHGLFALEERALSSGCIRLEDAGALTRWLLTERSTLKTPEQLTAVFNSGRETTVRLDRHIPVHLLYWTAWIDEDDRVHFRRDVYQRDRRLIDALNAAPPLPVTNES
jgi:L,D-transpeptidase YcbB